MLYVTAFINRIQKTFKIMSVMKYILKTLSIKCIYTILKRWSVFTNRRVKKIKNSDL